MTVVSVCIPSYNASRFIGATLRSVLDSTYTDLEIVVYDDASTDNTRDIVEAIDDSRIHLYQNQSNVGPVRNWNCALSKSSGDFVGLLNHDDLYGPFWLTFAVHILEKYLHIGWVATAFHIVDQKGETIGSRTRFPHSGEVDPAEAFAFIARLDGLGPAYVARRDVLESVGFYDPEAGPGADNDLFLRLAARYPLYYSANPHHAAWRLHPGNLTHRWGIVDQAEESLYILGKAFNDNATPDSLKRQKRNCYVYFYKKVIDRISERLAQGDLETAKQLIRSLYLNGYNDST